MHQTETKIPTQRGVRERIAGVRASLPGAKKEAEYAPARLSSSPGQKERKSWNIELTSSKVKPQEVMNLSRQLGAFLQAGLPILTAVEMLARESSSAQLKAILLDVERGLRSGESMADCFDRHPKVFPAFYRGVLRSAELTGRLDSVLEELATYMERDLEAKRKVRSALTYPMVVGVMAAVTVVVLSVFVMPRFQTFFANMDAELPLPTRMLLGVTDFFSSYWWLIALVMIGAVTGVVMGLRTVQGRLVRDRILLRIPLLKDVIQFSLVERFCRILASMVAAGVTLPQALRVAGESLENLVYSRALASVEDEILSGDGLAGPLSKTELFPATAAQMIRVGEDSGSLDQQLESTARYYEKELDYKVKRFTSAFEPVVIVVMGGIVGFVAVALISAMYGIFNSAGSLG